MFSDENLVLNAAKIVVDISNTKKNWASNRQMSWATGLNQVCLLPV
jgi:hypothetical protein